MKSKLTQALLAVALTGLAHTAQAAPEIAAESPSFQTVTLLTPATCHALMTEAECTRFKSTLTQLTPGAARTNYLAEHLATMQEREATCSCNQKVMSKTLSRLRNQAMLRL
jgi:hypothetical protein